MSDIFRDVDEALQREKAEKFWKEYGPTLVLAVIVLVLATAATTAWRTWDGWRDREETAKIIAAIEQTDNAPALIKAAEDTRGGHEAVALMAAANRVADKKDFAKAAELYGQVAGRNAPAGLSDLAAILEVRSLMLQEGKSGDIKAHAATLEKIANDGKSPFQLLARLDAAVLYGDGMNDPKKALTFLTGFDGASVPDSLKEKASALKNVYGSQSGESK